MERLRQWLCPTPAHRVRVVEASPRIRKARIVTAGAIGLGVLAAGAWIGWWPIVLFIPTGSYLLTMDRLLDRSDSPELIAVNTLLAMLGVLAIAAAITGGSQSPMLAWLAIVPAMAALRFRWAVSRALAGVAAVLIVGVAVGVDPGAVWDDPVMMICALVMLACIVGVTTALMEGELEHRDRAVIDPLTALLNRSALESRIPELEQQARLGGGSVCLILCDIDRFKQTSSNERSDLRMTYRIGGEELLVVLPDKEVAEGLEVGERLRMEVERARPAGLELTLSAGVAAAAGESVRYEELFRWADAALLRAKREGRNRVVVATGPLLSRAA
jgi:GGDEF domain-containing protein